MTGEAGDLERVVGSGAGWTAGAESVYGIAETDGKGIKGITMTALNNNKRAMLDLNQGTSQSTSYTDFDYAKSFTNGQLQVYENGKVVICSSGKVQM